MRCYNCHKNFDYEKYYGICPKCGCFNQKETREERHEDLHDRFGDSYTHSEERRQEASAHGMSGASENVRKAAARPEAKKTAGSRGKGFLIFSIIVFVAGFAVLGSGIGASIFMAADSAAQSDDTLRLIAHEAGETFDFQQGSLQVLEAVKLADRETLPGLEEGMQLIAVHVAGESDGEYEDCNRIKEPYLEADGAFRNSISAHEFEPYGQMLGARPALDGWDLSGESSCDGWYGFVTEADAQEIRIWFDEYDWSEWDGGNLLAAHYVDLQITAPETEASEAEAEGGLTDAE